MDVGVRELKQHLSEYLARAAAGELIRVTDRGQPRALIGPVPGQTLLEVGVAEGWIRRGSGKPRRRTTRERGSMSIAEAVDEDRDDR